MVVTTQNQTFRIAFKMLTYCIAIKHPEKKVCRKALKKLQDNSTGFIHSSIHSFNKYIEIPQWVRSVVSSGKEGMRKTINTVLVLVGLILYWW